MSSPFDIYGPSWAKGCEICDYGLISPPPIEQISGEHYIIRVYQAQAGVLRFCTCKAGEMYRLYLRRKWFDIKAGRDFVPPAMHKNISEYTALQEAGETPTVRWVGGVRDEKQIESIP